MHIGWSVGRMAGSSHEERSRNAVINTPLDFTAAGTLHVHTKNDLLAHRSCGTLCRQSYDTCRGAGPGHNLL